MYQQHPPQNPNPPHLSEKVLVRRGLKPKEPPPPKEPEYQPPPRVEKWEPEESE